MQTRMCSVVRVGTVVAIASCVLAAGCTGGSSDGTGSGNGQIGGGGSGTVTDRTTESALRELAGEWRVESINGTAYAEMMPKGAITRRPSMKIDANSPSPDAVNARTVSGFAGVNRFSGRLDGTNVATGTFGLSPVAMTKMAGPEASMKIEQAFAEALTKARMYTIADQRLTIKDDSGKSVLEFSKVNE